MQLDEILEQQRSWKHNDPISIEHLLSQPLAIREQSDAVVDPIYAETLLREQRGEHPSVEEYVSRFPKLNGSIEKQFQVHRALKPADEAEVLADADFKTISQDVSFAASFGAIPPAVPGFELSEMLGRGGSGVVWQARDVKLDRTVAIKFLLDIESKGDKGPTKDERLSREATAAAKLFHPSIVQVYQVGEAEGVPFLVMEFVEGGSLAEKLRAGPLPTAKCVELATSIAEAIGHAHEKGIIHCDIKPGNILLGLDGSPQVCDFGLARSLDADFSLHQAGDVLGTPAYMPPEQARGDESDERSDVYAIGAVLYESLCGRSPFKAAHRWEVLYQVTTIDRLPLRQLNPAIPIELETICQKCLEKNSERRYQTTADLAADLKRYSEGNPIHARPVSAGHKLFKWCLRNKVVAGLAAVSLLLLTTLAIGSTVAALKLSESNEKILQKQHLANETQEKAFHDLESKMLPLEFQQEIAFAAIVGSCKITNG